MIEHRWEDHGLVRRHDGVVSLNDIAQSDSNVQDDPRFHGIDFVIDDFLGCRNVVDIDMSVVDELAAFEGLEVRVPQVFRHAVVTTSPVVSALYDEFANSGYLTYPLRTFQHMTDARQWVAAES